MDAKMLQSISPTQLYDSRKNALDTLVNDYLRQQAATRAHLTPDQYVKREMHPAKITETDTQKFYNDKKSRFETTSSIIRSDQSASGGRAAATRR